MVTSTQSVLWALIDAVPAADRNEKKMTGLLLSGLSRLPLPRVVRFQRELFDCMDDLLTWSLWEAADVVHGEPCSGDTFVDFRFWIVAQGSQVFRAVLHEPDSLADIAEIERVVRLRQPWDDSDFPHFASLGMLAGDAFDRTLERLGPSLPGPVDRPAVLDEPAAAYPRDRAPLDFGDELAVRDRLPRLAGLRRGGSTWPVDS